MSSSPPAPPPPPPSRETDVAFGIILILMGLMFAAFLFYLPTLLKPYRSKPLAAADSQNSSTTSKANARKDFKEDDLAASLPGIPRTVIKPFSLP
jgi:hypothetical protein